MHKKNKISPADLKGMRTRMGMSQAEFARMIGVSIGTLRNWEQGRRRPEGPAQALLAVAQVRPRAVEETLSPAASEEFDLPPDPVIEFYKKRVDRAVLRENLKMSVEERINNLVARQRLAEEARRVRLRKKPKRRRGPAA